MELTKLRNYAVATMASFLLTGQTASAAEQVIIAIPQIVAVESRAPASEPNAERRRFGGCYAALPANTVTMNGCNPSYVTFACDGSTSITKNQAKLSYDNAVLAYVLNTSVKIRMTDQINLDGVCGALNSQVAR